MLLTLTMTHRPTDELGYLLHKHPERFQSAVRMPLTAGLDMLPVRGGRALGSVAARFGDEVRFLPMGPEHERLRLPTQMAVFQRTERPKRSRPNGPSA